MQSIRYRVHSHKRVTIAPAKPGSENNTDKIMTTTENLVAITGNTYPVKEQLKSIGARWNGDAKAWMVVPEKADEARKIVAGAGPKKAYSGGASRYGSYATIGQRTNERMRRTGWTGCSCGSIEGHPRSSDCAQCQHDY